MREHDENAIVDGEKQTLSVVTLRHSTREEKEEKQPPGKPPSRIRGTS